MLEFLNRFLQLFVATLMIKVIHAVVISNASVSNAKLKLAKKLSKS